MTRLLTVLLNYRTAQMTLRAAEAALADFEHLPADVQAELVIVDNASGDGSADVLVSEIAARDWADRGVRFIASPVNGGFGAGNNVGIRAGMADGGAPDFVYILNSDAFPDAGCIGTLLGFLQSHPKAGFAGSHVRGEDDVPHTTAFRFPSIAGELEGAARTGLITRLVRDRVVPLGVPEQAQEVDWSAGASMMIRYDALREIGLFDETFFLYFEETDLCLRAKRAGWQVWYLPQSRVVHIGSVSTGMKTWTRMPPYWFDSRSHYFRKNHGALYAGLATVAHVVGALIWRLRRFLQNKPQRDPDHFLGDLIAHSLRRPVQPPKLTPSEDTL